MTRPPQPEQESNASKTVLICFDSHTPYLALRVSSLAKSLQDRGLGNRIRLRVVLIAVDDRSYGWNTDDLSDAYGGVPVEILSSKFERPGLKGALHPSAMASGFRFFRLLLKRRPKIVLVGGWDRMESVAAAMSAWLFRWRVGVMTDSRFSDAEILERDVFSERLKSLVVRRFHFFMCSGHACVEYVRFLAGRKKPVYYGALDMVDNEGIARSAEDSSLDGAIADHLGVDAQAPYFLMPVRFVAKKNVGRVLQAYAGYSKSSEGHTIPLVICGQGPLEQDYRDQVVELGLEGQVRIVPWLDYAQVPRAARLSRAVILASTHDQWGLIVNESLAAGAPVLVSSACGAQELVQNGMNGFTFHPLDVEHLAWLFGEMGGNDDLVTAMRRHAGPSIRHFSVQGFLDACDSVFERYGLLETS